MDELEENPNVERISLVGTKRIFLQDSVPLINASYSNSLVLNGVNLTGKGQTVCIIDTGVNYSHPDLGGCFGANCKVIGGYDFVNNDADPMDDNGHGTHVAGIIAANGSINGVAPEAKIVALKVCNSGGSCSDNNVISAINWCVGNSSVYNISVISMSLGGAFNFTSYCDSDTTENSDIYAAPINSAFAKNISFAISSGNSGNSTSVSSPACIQNATRVGATTKSDGIASYSNRWALDMLFAPGSAINSTMTISNSSLKSVCDKLSRSSLISSGLLKTGIIKEKYIFFVSFILNRFIITKIIFINKKTINFLLMVIYINLDNNLFFKIL